MDNRQKDNLSELIVEALDGVLTPERQQELDLLLSGDPQALEYYVWHVKVFSTFVMPGRAFSDADTSGETDAFDVQLWNELAQDEKSAAAVPAAKDAPEKELVRKVVYKKTPHRISRANLYLAVVSTAALLAITVLLPFVPGRAGYAVATLSDSVQARWAGDSIQAGDRLRVDRSPLVLKQGCAELLFDTNARVIVEAPAEFEIVADDRIDLNYGRIYASVPREAIGFKIYSPSAQVIDLGTEFGIEADAVGNTSLHMMKGKTMLIAGQTGGKIGIEVSRGSAKHVSAHTGGVADISCNETHFVRAFDSKNNILWRQRPSLDLADIVRAGNGLGTGNSKVRLSPVKGLNYDYHGGFVRVKGYLPIPELPFIDGIFVPDGETGQVVSTRGDVFEQCPDTSGIVDLDLLATPQPEIFKTELRDGTIRFNDIEYSENGKPCIVMHANHGLTFDLDAIRRHFPLKITRFVSGVGIADLHEKCNCNADIWVLLDGQVRYSLRQYKQKGVLNDISVEIRDTDRFLTLVTTDGGDPDDPQSFYTRAISCDWCVFTEPVLELD